METETYNIVSICVTVLGFTLTFIGILFLHRQLVSANKDRETDLLVRLYALSTQEPLAADFNTIWDMNSEQFEKHAEPCLRACLFFEIVGAITTQEHVDTVLIEEFFGSLISGSYESLERTF